MITRQRALVLVLIFVGLSFLALKLQQQGVPLDARLVALDDSVRASALRSFVKLPERDREGVVEGLIYTRVVSSDARERRFALYALRKSGLSTDAIIGTMVQGLSDGNPKVREEAGVGLQEMGDKAVIALVDALGKNQEGREEITAKLVDVASEKTMPLLISALKDDSELRVRGVAGVFWRIKNPALLAAARPALPILAELLRSTDPVTSLNAAFSLHAIDFFDKRPVPVFLRLVQQEDWDSWRVRGWAAARALGEIPAGAPESLPVLKRLARTKKEGFRPDGEFPRAVIAEQLERLDPRDRSLNGLVWDLKHSDPLIRYRALLVVSSSPVISPVLREPLLARLADEDRANAARAFMSLRQMGLKEVAGPTGAAYPKYFSVLERVSNEQSENFPYTAASSIAGLSPDVLPALADGVKQKTVRLETALEIIGFVDRSAFAYLKELLGDKNSDARLLAAVGLRRIVPETPGVETELDGLTGRSASVRAAAARAMERKVPLGLNVK